MKTQLLFDVFRTEIGDLTVVVDDSGAVAEIWTSDASERLLASGGYVRDPSAIAEPRRQLEEYSAGKRTTFDLRLAAKGTEFQHQVWDQLVRIPFGETRSYGELAAMLGNGNASRAVGRANATNPISIVVPCHRVIGSTGELTGYAGGLPMKRKLLQLEGVLGPALFQDA